jgi:2,5-dihydroxypyridine 5,6-dioxygenase
MLQETLEPAWLDAFEAVLRRCALQPGNTVAVLSESQSRPVLPAWPGWRRPAIGCACSA